MNDDYVSLSEKYNIHFNTLVSGGDLKITSNVCVCVSEYNNNRK